jgi:hypothetical protein
MLEKAGSSDRAGPSAALVAVDVKDGRGRLNRRGQALQGCRFDCSRCPSPVQRASATLGPFRLGMGGVGNRPALLALLEGIASHIADSVWVPTCSSPIQNKRRNA